MARCWPLGSVFPVVPATTAFIRLCDCGKRFPRESPSRPMLYTQRLFGKRTRCSSRSLALSRLSLLAQSGSAADLLRAGATAVRNNLPRSPKRCAIRRNCRAAAVPRFCAAPLSPRRSEYWTHFCKPWRGLLQERASCGEAAWVLCGTSVSEPACGEAASAGGAGGYTRVRRRRTARGAGAKAS